MRIDEPGPVSGLLGVDDADTGYLELITGVGLIARTARSQIADIFVEILVFLDGDAGFGIGAIAHRSRTSNIYLLAKELLLERSVALDTALGRFSLIS